MKNRRRFWLMVLLVELIALSAVTKNASAAYHGQLQTDRHLAGEQLAAPTLIPTVSPSFPEIETPESRVLPPVGGNAGLVLAASVLVLIIIGGVVLSSRRKLKH